MTDTRSKRIGQTVFFKHKYITMPALTSADAVVQAAKELVSALKGKLPPPLTQPSTAQLKTLETIFTPDMDDGRRGYQRQPGRASRAQTHSKTVHPKPPHPKHNTRRPGRANRGCGCTTA